MSAFERTLKLLLVGAYRIVSPVIDICLLFNAQYSSLGVKDVRLMITFSLIFTSTNYRQHYYKAVVLLCPCVSTIIFETNNL